MTAPHAPIAPFSFSIGKVARSSASAVGCSIAPKTPCSTRNAISSEMLEAMEPDRPAAAEVAAKPTMPTRNTFRWPNRSPTLPTVISVTASESRYPLVTHWMSASDAPSLAWIEGLATATIVPSMATIITPSAADSSVSPGLPRSPRRRAGCVSAFLPMAMSAGWLTAVLLIVLEDRF
jgi:hypothetical protein